MSYRKLLKKSLHLSKKSFDTLQKKFEMEQKNAVVRVPCEKMAVFMRDNMGVFNHVQALIFGQCLSDSNIISGQP